MKFKRIESQTHQIDGISLLTSYDRFTGRITLSSVSNKAVSNKAVLASKNMFLSPFSPRSFCLNDKQYQLRASWVLLWQSSIVEIVQPHNTSVSIINELLPKRRRRTVMVCSYVAMMSLIKLAFLLTAPI